MELEPKHYDFIEAMLECGGSIQEASEKVGKTRQWGYDQWRIPEVQAEYRQQRAKLLDSLVSKLIAASGIATAKLVEVMEDPESTPTVKISASRAILEYAFKGIEAANLEKRIEELEETMNGHDY